MRGWTLRYSSCLARERWNGYDARAARGGVADFRTPTLSAAFKKHAFDSHVSILDLIANHGETESMAILRRGRGDSQFRHLASDNT